MRLESGRSKTCLLTLAVLRRAFHKASFRLRHSERCRISVLAPVVLRLQITSFRSQSTLCCRVHMESRSWFLRHIVGLILHIHGIAFLPGMADLVEKRWHVGLKQHQQAMQLCTIYHVFAGWRRNNPAARKQSSNKTKPTWRTRATGHEYW